MSDVTLVLTGSGCIKYLLSVKRTVTERARRRPGTRGGGNPWARQPLQRSLQEHIAGASMIDEGSSISLRQSSGLRLRFDLFSTALAAWRIIDACRCQIATGPLPGYRKHRPIPWRILSPNALSRPGRHRVATVLMWCKPQSTPRPLEPSGSHTWCRMGHWHRNLW